MVYEVDFVEDDEVILSHEHLKELIKRGYTTGVAYAKQGYVKMSKKGRQITSESDASNKSTGTVIVVNNSAMRLLIRMYFKLNKPKYPFFTKPTLEEAIAKAKTLLN